MNARLSYLLTPCLTLLAVQAHALERVAVTSTQDNFVVAQIDGELRTLGFDVSSVDAPPDTALDDAELLRTVAGRAEVEALVVVTGDPSSLSVVIAVFGPGTRVVTRKVTGIKAQEEGAARVSALRVVEILRAELAARPETYAEKKQEKTPKPPIKKVAPLPPEHVWRLHLAPVFGRLGDDLGFLPMLRAGGSRRLPAGFEIVFDATSMLTPRRFSLSAGDVTSWVGTTSLGVAWVPGDAYWSFPLEARVGVGVTRFQGFTAAPNVGQIGWLASPMVEARVGARRRLLDNLHLQAGVSVQSLGVDHRVRVGEDVAMRWGALGGLVDLGVAWTFGEVTRRPETSSRAEMAKASRLCYHCAESRPPHIMSAPTTSLRP